MISCGSTTIKINEHFQTVNAPAVLCISQYDKFQCIEQTHLSAKAFHFDPWYIKACLRFENLDDNISIDEKYIYERNMLYMFTKHSGNFQGIFHLTPQQYIHINELMLVIGAETYTQSDDYWTCRIRRLLHQTINCIEYLLHYRLKIAQELLSNTNLKIEEIASQCGFKYGSYSNRQFTKCLGISPSEFRKNPTGYSSFDGGKVWKL